MLPPAPPAPSPLSRMQQARRTGLSKKQRSARTRGSHAELANLGLPSQDCTVGTAFAFCGYATNEVDRNASMLQAHNVDTHAHTQSHTHTHIHTHAQAHTLTQAHTRTHIHTHARAHAHAHTHTYTHTTSLSSTLAHMRAHTHTHTHMHTL